MHFHCLWPNVGGDLVKLNASNKVINLALKRNMYVKSEGENSTLIHLIFSTKKMRLLKENYYGNLYVSLNTVNTAFILEHAGLILQSLLPKIQTQLSRVLLEKSTVAERVKQFLRLLWNNAFILSVRNSEVLEAWVNSIRSHGHILFHEDVLLFHPCLGLPNVPFL